MTTETAERKPAPLAIFRTQLEEREQTLTALLQEDVPFELFVTAAQHAVLRQPELLTVNRESLFASLREAARLRLDISGALGRAYLIPYKGKAQLIVGYQGLIELSRRSGEVAGVEAHVIYAGDEFAVEFGTSPSLHHFPTLDPQKRGDRVGAYMVARLRNGPPHVELMTSAEIEQVRGQAPAGSSKVGPWTTAYDEMAKKTVTRRGMKWLPLSAEVVSQLAAIDEAEGWHDISVAEPPPEGAGSNARKRLVGRVQRITGKAPVEAPGTTEAAAVAPEAAPGAPGPDGAPEPAQRLPIDEDDGLPTIEEALARQATLPLE